MIKNLSIYAAYQSVHMHAHLEVPEKYLHECQSIPYENRCIFCGMLRVTALAPQVDRKYKVLTVVLIV